MKKFARKIYFLLGDLGINPFEMFRRLRGLPYFFSNLRAWQRAQLGTFPARLSELRFLTWERFSDAGGATGHYFHQDLWVANRLFKTDTTRHVDVGSRLDGFIAHILPFCSVTFVDLRPISLSHDNFSFVQGTINALPFPNASVASLSCLHVIEHIGLGRYGDEVDPDGHRKAAAELVRVLAPGGRLYLGTPVGRQRLVFDAHRIFDPETIVEAFAPARLVSFHLISDAGDRVMENASFDEARRCDYGCGIFIFEPAETANLNQ